MSCSGSPAIVALELGGGDQGEHPQEHAHNPEPGGGTNEAPAGHVATSTCHLCPTQHSVFLRFPQQPGADGLGATLHPEAPAPWVGTYQTPEALSSLKWTLC